MDLDERKQRILNAIIQNYLETGEPVGSRTISKMSGLNLSSATIRNEMSDLEEMGLIEQPHTSAGRIPTDKGYRLYVNQLMEREQDAEGQNEFLVEKVDRLELMMKQIARYLAANTNYASLIVGPRYNHVKLKFLQLSRVEDTQLVLMVVTEGNQIKNQMIRLTEPLSDDEILALNLHLNTHLSGLSMDDINLDVIRQLKECSGQLDELITRILDAIGDCLKAEEELQVYTSGAPNIFKYPELADSGRASGLIGTLEDKAELAGLLSGAMDESDKQEIQVYIGDELSMPAMKDCSVVTASYELGEGVYGRIGIIGPKRMNYEKVLSTLKETKMRLREIFRGEEE